MRRAALRYVRPGTAGLHSYLVGQAGDRSVLDAVRAAKRLQGVRPPTTPDVAWNDSCFSGGSATTSRAPS
jgi:hypothetical protein